MLKCVILSDYVRTYKGNEQPVRKNRDLCYL